MSNQARIHAHGTFFSSLLSVCVACTVLATPVFGQDQPNGADVNVTDYGTIDLAVQDTDLAQVLQMLSIQSQKNIITSRNVSATVTANLFDVTFHEALDSILRVNGYGFIEEGNFIYIYTQAELEEIELARRRTESRIFELEHLSALDAREFIEPLLSDEGRISVRGEVQRGFQPDMQDGGADEYAFSVKIVVNDYPEHLDAIQQLLSDLDTSPQQVLVEATVLRTTLNEDNAFGIDFTVIGNIDIRSLSNPLSAVTDLITGTGRDELHIRESETGDLTITEIPHQQPKRAVGVTSTVGGTAGPGGLKVGVIRDDISIFMRLLDEVTDTTVLARPKIMALNRQRAEVLVGERVPFRSTTATDTSATQTIEFLNTGIELTFRPFISNTGMIRLELKPKVSFAIREEIAEGETAPREFTNELTTNVRVRDGQTLILGGLFQEEIDRTRRQVPLLGDIPVLGSAFRGHEDRVRRSEIIFLITPSIIQDDALWEIGRESLSHVETVQVGARRGLLPFSRERITTNYNRRALEALQEDDVNLAHYYINNSLRLNPNQPEMSRLRQEVTGVRERLYERSVLERIIRRHLDTGAGHGDARFMGSAKSTAAASGSSQPASHTPDPQPQQHSEATSDSPEASPVAEAIVAHESDESEPIAEVMVEHDADTMDGPPEQSAWMWNDLYQRLRWSPFFSNNFFESFPSASGEDQPDSTLAGAADADQRGK